MDEYPIHVTAKIEGIVLPSWFAISLGLVTVMATVTLLFCWMTIQSLNREIRILQLHTADMENVLIRQGVATRQDFAQWSTSLPPSQSPQSLQSQPSTSHSPGTGKE